MTESKFYDSTDPFCFVEAVQEGGDVMVLRIPARHNLALYYQLIIAETPKPTSASSPSI